MTPRAPALAWLAFLHPGWLTAGLAVALLLAVGAGYLTGLARLLNLPGAVLLFLWPHAVYQVSRQAAGDRRGPNREWVYLAAETALAGLALVQLLGVASADLNRFPFNLVAVPPVLVWIGGNWFAAAELVRSEGGKPNFNTSGSAYLMMLWPFAPWIFRKRLLAVRASLA